MLSKQPATELITKRRSCRSFTGHALDDDVRTKLMDMQRVDMGIAMSHFELACREEGVGGAGLI